MLTTEALISELQEDEKSPGDVRRFGHVIPFAKYRNSRNLEENLYALKKLRKSAIGAWARITCRMSLAPLRG